MAARISNQVKVLLDPLRKIKIMNAYINYIRNGLQKTE